MIIGPAPGRPRQALLSLGLGRLNPSQLGGRADPLGFVFSLRQELQRTRFGEFTDELCKVVRLEIAAKPRVKLLL